MPHCILGLLVALAFGAGAAQRPNDETVWKFTPYLKGTTTEVRDLLNGELERQIAMRAETFTRIIQTKAEIKANTEQAVATVRRHPDYLNLKAKRDTADAARAEAKLRGTMEDRLDNSAKFNNARLAMEKMEQAAPAHSQAVLIAQERLAELEQSLQRSDDTIAKSGKWRDELIESIRNAYRLRAPLRVNEVGLIGDATCEKVVDADTVLLSIEGWLGDGVAVGKEEGIRVVNVRVVTAHVLLVGLDTSTMKEGVAITVNRQVKIRSSHRAAELGRVFDAVFQVDNVDRLFQAIIPLKDPKDVDLFAPRKARMAAGSQAAKAATRPVSLDLDNDPRAIFDEKFDSTAASLRGVRLGDGAQAFPPTAALPSGDSRVVGLPDGDSLVLGDGDKVKLLVVGSKAALGKLDIKTEADVQERFGKADEVIEDGTVKQWVYRGRNVRVVWIVGIGLSHFSVGR